MSSAEPKKGDRVRVTHVGTYVRHDPAYYTVSSGNGTGNHMFDVNDPNTTIEVLEPEYIPGEVYQDAKGEKYLRTSHPNLSWRPIRSWALNIADVGHDYPKRPLVRLVPENG